MTERPQIRAPRNGEFFRINPDPAQRDEVTLSRDDNGVLYLIAPHLVPDLMRRAPERLEHCMMFVGQNKDGETFLWPVTMPVPDDHPAFQAMTKWICLRGMH